MASDYHGRPLTEGADVMAWLDGMAYTATVKEIKPQEPGNTYCHVILVRDDDRTEVKGFSDAVTVLGFHGSESGG